MMLRNLIRRWLGIDSEVQIQLWETQIRVGSLEKRIEALEETVRQDGLLIEELEDQSRRQNSAWPRHSPERYAEVNPPATPATDPLPKDGRGTTPTCESTGGGNENSTWDWTVDPEHLKR